MDTNERSILLKYFNDECFSYNSSTRYSTFKAALYECRLFTRRDTKTGKYNPDAKFGNSENWLGTIGYFSLLDQIGSCYKPVGNPTPVSPNYNKIKFAIESFGHDIIDNDARKLHALIALRNSFTHDFNLLNIPQSANKIALEQHKFTVYSDPSKENEVVTLPTVQWNGDIINKSFTQTDDSTFINLFAFGTLVETIVSRLLENTTNNQIELLIQFSELINKYTFVTSSHPISH